MDAEFLETRLAHKVVRTDMFLLSTNRMTADRDTPKTRFYCKASLLIAVREFDQNHGFLLKELGGLLQTPEWSGKFHEVGQVLRGGNEQEEVDLSLLNSSLKSLDVDQLNELLEFLP